MPDEVPGAWPIPVTDQPKPLVPDVAPVALAYYRLPGNGSGGSLHVVLDDTNLEDHSVRFCADWASAHGDYAGWSLALLLLRMTRSQRGRVGKRVHRVLGAEAQSWRTGL